MLKAFKNIQRDSALFRSRFGRRILLLFIICSLVPIIALGAVSYGQVSRQLILEANRSLRHETKAFGMSIYEKLSLMNSRLNLLIQEIRVQLTDKMDINTEDFNEYKQKMFLSVALIRNGHYRSLWGRPISKPVLSKLEDHSLRQGKAVLLAREAPGAQARLIMVRLLENEKNNNDLIFCEMNTNYLWGIGRANTLPPMTELYVHDSLQRVLVTSLPEDTRLEEYISKEDRQAHSLLFEWVYDGEKQLAARWTIFIKNDFYPDKWIVLFSRSKNDVLYPMIKFRRIFPFVLLLSFWFVLLLSLYLIRRNLTPLQMLKEATKWIAEGDYGKRVHIESRDEFEDLGGSFNNMAGQIAKHFKMMHTMAEVDRGILSTLNTEFILTTVLEQFPELFSCEMVSVSLVDNDNPNGGRTYIKNPGRQGKLIVTQFRLSDQNIEELQRHRTHFVVDGNNPGLPYLSFSTNNDFKTFAVLPILLKERLAAIITLGYKQDTISEPGDLDGARQLADQVAVALSNARLISDLDQLNWGALTALARTVDAKSPWTAGHSERVTEHALRIGRRLGLNKEELNTLHRASLLHDIGKIGIPLEIIDKAGQLTESEYLSVKKHPEIGVRIIEPITAFYEVAPIILQHHERYDGKGYPFGLAGDEISLGARILAVADVYDALANDRPYRVGLKITTVLEHIEQGAGSQFDPRVVDVFVDYMKKRK